MPALVTDHLRPPFNLDYDAVIEECRVQLMRQRRPQCVKE